MGFADGGMALRVSCLGMAYSSCRKDLQKVFSTEMPNGKTALFDLMPTLEVPKTKSGHRIKKSYFKAFRFECAATLVREEQLCVHISLQDRR